MPTNFETLLPRSRPLWSQQGAEPAQGGGAVSLEESRVMAEVPGCGPDSFNTHRNNTALFAS